MSGMLDLISIVLPVYNEEETVPLLLPRIREMLEQLPCRAEVIFVNDGSKDATGRLLAQAAQQDDRLKIIEFSRNFGHQVAITAGTDFAEGDAVVVMDADLQDPPEIVCKMIDKYHEGFDVVYAQRTRRHGESRFKRWTAAGFYWLMRRAVHKDLPANTGDFRLMSRAVVEALRQLREQHRFVRGMVTWLGFRQTSIQFERPARAAGQTKYPLRKMLAFAWRAITSFSALPMRLILLLGFILAMGSLVFTVAGPSIAAVFVIPLPSWTWLVVLQMGLTGVTLTSVGVLGDYIGRVYEEIKQRPLYIVQEFINFHRARMLEIPPRASICLRSENGNGAGEPVRRNPAAEQHSIRDDL